MTAASNVNTSIFAHASASMMDYSSPCLYPAEPMHAQNDQSYEQSDVDDEYDDDLQDEGSSVDDGSRYDDNDSSGEKHVQVIPRRKRGEPADVNRKGVKLGISEIKEYFHMRQSEAAKRLVSQMPILSFSSTLLLQRFHPNSLPPGHQSASLSLNLLSRRFLTKFTTGHFLDGDEERMQEDRADALAVCPAEEGKDQGPCRACAPSPWELCCLLVLRLGTQLPCCPPVSGGQHRLELPERWRLLFEQRQSGTAGSAGGG
eukprot:767480-Hanusia_phi.AAC.3